MNICVTYHTCVEHYFSDIALAITSAFRFLGHIATLRVSMTDDLSKVTNSNDNMVFAVGMHAFHTLSTKLSNCVYAGWECEQLVGNDNFNKVKLQYFHKSAPIYDVIVVDLPSKVTVLQVPQRVLPLPLGYDHSFDYGITNRPKQYDVLFYGTINQRRANILDQLYKLGYHLCTIDANQHHFVTNSHRAELIAQSRICLNIHISNELYFEQHRIIKDYACNRACVVTEQLSEDTNLDVPQAPYSQLCDAVKELIEEDYVQTGLELYNEITTKRPTLRDNLQTFLQLLNKE